jgi:hypothetical protein
MLRAAREAESLVDRSWLLWRPWSSSEHPWGSRLRGEIDCQVLFGKSASRYTKTSGKMNKQT